MHRMRLLFRCLDVFYGIVLEQADTQKANLCEAKGVDVRCLLRELLLR